jgi:hypothetical protein
MTPTRAKAAEVADVIAWIDARIAKYREGKKTTVSDAAQAWMDIVITELRAVRRRLAKGKGR